MAKPVFIPKFGFTLEESELVEWLVEEGATVEAGDPVAEVTTDKVNMEVEAPMDGILAGICAQVGDMVPVTATIAWVLAPGEELPAEALVDAAGSSKSPSEESSQSVETPVATALGSNSAGSGGAGSGSAGSAVVQSSPVAARMAEAHRVDLNQIKGSGPRGRIERRDVEAQLAAGVSATGDPNKVRATPAARRIASESEIDLTTLNGSGPRGRIQAADVVDATSHQPSATLALSDVEGSHPCPERCRREPPVTISEGGITRIPFTNMRRTIARRLQQSVQEAPHIFFEATVDVSEMQALCATANQQSNNDDAKVSLTAGITRAVAWALGRHPLVNSHIGDDEALLFDAIHIGMAVALENGLVVPVIRHADRKGLREISVEIRTLAEKARNGKLTPADMSGSTFSISNLGMFGVERFTAIINPPEVGILAVGSVQKTLVVGENDQPVVRPIMGLTLSVDHRVIDGAVAAQFLADLKKAIEHPSMMLM